MPWDTSLDTRADPDYRRCHRLSLREGGTLHNWVSSAIDSTFVVSANVMYALPFWLPDTMRVARLITEVTTLAAGNVRMNVYKDLNGYPDTPLVSETAVSTGTTGIKTQNINLTIPCGFYWGACVFDATPTMRDDGASSTGIAQWLGFTSATDVVAHAGISVSFTYAAMPSPFTAGGVPITTALPRMLLTMGQYGHLA